jgi:hypothetical protein
MVIDEEAENESQGSCHPDDPSPYLSAEDVWKRLEGMLHLDDAHVKTPGEGTFPPGVFSVFAIHDVEGGPDVVETEAYPPVVAHATSAHQGPDPVSVSGG